MLVQCSIFDVLIVRDNKFSLLHRNCLAISVINIHRKIKKVLFSTRVMFIPAFRTNNGVILVNIILFNCNHFCTIRIKTLKYFIKSLSINMLWTVLAYFVQVTIYLPTCHAYSSTNNLNVSIPRASAIR